MRTLPSSGSRRCNSVSSKVVLPAPLGPTMPRRSPRMRRSEKSLIGGARRKPFDTLGFNDQLPELVPRSAWIGGAGVSGHAEAFAALGAHGQRAFRRRPSLRERRAVTPRCSQCSSVLRCVSGARCARFFQLDVCGPFVERAKAAIEFDEATLAEP